MKLKPIYQWNSVLLAALALVLVAAGAGEAAAAEPAAAKPKDDVIKVVYHVDFADPRRFSAMLTNINNMVSVYQSQLADYD
ncbi:MAG TPA: hypothetical protein VEI74_13100, partial [Candidatus Methylomirabilis sp.]|nr:hypothetical protein [Candidatus Methylomirabilis sp.]